MILKFIPEKMILNYGEDVYNKVSEITGLKFKSQIKSSGIQFQEIYEMENLISKEKNYLLFTNTDNIWFSDKNEFIQKFIILIKKSISKLNEDFKINEENQNLPIVDENIIYIENERIGHCGDKQIKLLNKIREFRVVEPDVNIK
jgi:hypothetical protein